MAQNAAAIYRDTGAITINGNNVGFTSESEGGLTLTVKWERIPIRVNERGITVNKTLHGGVDVTGRIMLAQWDATTFGEAFRSFDNGSGTAVIDVDTYAAGATISGVSFSFAGAAYTITASNCVVTVLGDLSVALFREQSIPLMLQFQPHSDGNIISIAPTP
jgi:hypothetical protein